LTNPTKENVEKLENLTGEYLALKKEFELMMYAISQAKENKDSRDYVVQIFN
jgi:flagellar basal body rod protein FlgF